jgi:hypothetical protein
VLETLAMLLPHFVWQRLAGQQGKSFDLEANVFCRHNQVEQIREPFWWRFLMLFDGLKKSEM